MTYLQLDRFRFTGHVTFHVNIHVTLLIHFNLKPNSRNLILCVADVSHFSSIKPLLTPLCKQPWMWLGFPQVNHPFFSAVFNNSAFRTAVIETNYAAVYWRWVSWRNRKRLTNCLRPTSAAPWGIETIKFGFSKWKVRGLQYPGVSSEDLTAVSCFASPLPFQTVSPSFAGCLSARRLFWDYDGK